MLAIAEHHAVALESKRPTGANSVENLARFAGQLADRNRVSLGENLASGNVGDRPGERESAQRDERRTDGPRATRS